MLPAGRRVPATRSNQDTECPINKQYPPLTGWHAGGGITDEKGGGQKARAYISRRFSCVFWSGFFPETQSAFLIGLESAEGYPLAVNDSPKRGKFPKNIPNHDVFMGTLPSSRHGKRVTLFGGVRDAPNEFLSL
ncbi:hypothetical protein TNCV_668681 [Trichonephila clavipes]|nr:hypothetical protein TNCV_668681 [Trichonephila clavipes]